MSSLDRVLAGLFDYAGMFPPAALSFDEALAKSASFPQLLRRPSLVGSDLVLDYRELEKVSDRALQEVAWSKERPVKIAVLGGVFSSKEASAVEARMKSAPDATRFQILYTSLEWKIGIPADANEALGHSVNSLVPQVAIEPDLSGENWFQHLEIVLRSLSEFPGAGALKVRGSGPSAITIPKLARVVALAGDANVSVKATGGFHHPIIERERYANTFGFLNLVMAWRLRLALGAEFSLVDTESCLGESDPQAFSFEGGIRWRNAVISEIPSFPSLTIGSCSIEEPDDDLSRLMIVE